MNNKGFKGTNENQRNYEYCNSTNEVGQFTDVGISTGKLDNWWDVTEIVVDLLWATEREFKD